MNTKASELVEEVTPDVAEITSEEAEQKLLATASDRMLTQIDEDIVNPIELARALDIRPQMVYNYIRNGKLLGVKHNNTQKIVIPWHAAVAFAANRYNRILKREQKVQEELNGK